MLQPIGKPDVRFSACAVDPECLWQPGRAQSDLIVVADRVQHRAAGSSISGGSTRVLPDLLLHSP
jgi:hypothetical protein